MSLLRESPFREITVMIVYQCALNIGNKKKKVLNYEIPFFSRGCYCSNVRMISLMEKSKRHECILLAVQTYGNIFQNASDSEKFNTNLILTGVLGLISAYFF